MFSPFTVNCAQPDDVSPRRLDATYARAETAEVRFVNPQPHISLVSPPDVSRETGSADADATEAPCVQVPDRLDEWTQQNEKRFQQLAHNYALDTLSPDQKREFARLTAERRIYHHPLPFNQIAFEYKRSSLLEEIQKALDKYVQFISVSRPTR